MNEINARFTCLRQRNSKTDELIVKQFFYVKATSLVVILSSNLTYLLLKSVQPFF